ncbi:MAG TPA: GatB/YqeY domain-containing protein [Candidatus Woesebacteria bacterium]|nr:GatB/YqeY domain-containing protein [Candidatus Woesebacteria bacterium]
MIKQKLQEDQIMAMKAKDVEKLQTLRYILAQIKNIEIDKKIELSDEEVVNVLRKEVKKLQDSIDSFKSAHREDLAQEYQIQKDIIVTYLPQELSDEELKSEVQKIIEANKPLFEQNPNALIGICVKELKSKADASRISTIVRSLQ